ncbi:unnamed protein product [Rotaria magnacalcarata]
MASNTTDNTQSIMVAESSSDSDSDFFFDPEYVLASSQNGFNTSHDTSDSSNGTTTTITSELSTFSRPYPPTECHGRVDEHDKPFREFGKIKPKAIAVLKKFRLPVKHVPYCEPDQTIRVPSNKNRLYSRKLAISSFSDRTKEETYQQVRQYFEAKKISVRYVCVAREITTKDTMPRIHIQIIFHGKPAIHPQFMDKFLNCQCEYHVTKHANAWNEYMKQGFSCIEHGLYKGSDKKGFKLWPKSSTTEKDDCLTDDIAAEAFKLSKKSVPVALRKTSFALSLPGIPNYYRGVWSIVYWDDDASYMIFDDIPFPSFDKKGYPSKKDLLTGQLEVCVRDIYCKSRKIVVNKPAIVLLNHADARPLLNPRTKEEIADLEFWKERAIIRVLEPNEHFYKPKPRTPSPENKIYTVEGLPLFDEFRRTWREEQQQQTVPPAPPPPTTTSIIMHPPPPPTTTSIIMHPPPPSPPPARSPTPSPTPSPPPTRTPTSSLPPTPPPPTTTSIINEKQTKKKRRLTRLLSAAYPYKRGFTMKISDNENKTICKRVAERLCQYMEIWRHEIHAEMWRCGQLEMWRCGQLQMWGCGQLQMWRCGQLEMRRRAQLEMWTFGDEKIVPRFDDVDIWRCGDLEMKNIV